jgi:hypothetical protein
VGGIEITTHPRKFSFWVYLSFVFSLGEICIQHEGAVHCFYLSWSERWAIGKAKKIDFSFFLDFQKT